MKAGSPCKSATLRRAPAKPGGPHRRAARATADRGEAPPEAQAKPGEARQPGRRQQGAKPKKGSAHDPKPKQSRAKPGSLGEGQRCGAAGGKEGENVAETNKATVQRVTRMLLQRAEELLDGKPLSSADLDKLSNVIKDAAAVLGVKSALDAREQRGKIAVLMRRAGGEDKQQGPLVIAWEDGTEYAAE